jgi:hypothetical protein
VPHKPTCCALQKLQRERKGELRDAVALEKDIAQAADSVADAERLQENLHNTLALAHIRFMLIEDYRAPLQVSLTGATLQLRNSFADGISTIFSTLALVFRIVLSYGLPVVFWLALLFWPLRYSYRRLRNRTATLSNAA